MSDQDIGKVRGQIARDYGQFYSLYRSQIDNLNLLLWWPGQVPLLSTDPYVSLAGDYFPGIIDSFYELISCYAYSLAAETIAQKHDQNGQKGYANHWRFLIRNYHFRMFIPRYYFLLDYCAFLLNELSSPDVLLKDTKSGEPRRVNYERMIVPLEEALNAKRKRGVLEEKDLSICYEALKEFKALLSEREEELLKRFRDVMTHRYLPGIDEMTVSTERTGSRTRVHSRHGKLLRIEQDSGSYELYGLPEFRFEDLEPVVRILLVSADQSLQKLHSMEAIRRAFSRSDSNGMKNRSQMPDYYRRVWEKWYSWFAYICDPFAKTFFFLFNGGFGGERRWRESIIDWVDPQPGDRILDICSGTGTLTMMLAERLGGEGEMVGIEISRSQLRVARKKEKVEGLSFIQGDAQHIPFSDRHFHRSVICGALHEMPQEMRQNVLAEAYRVTKPGGRIVITEHNKPGQKWKANLFDFLERFNPEYPTYRNMLACGLTNEIEQPGFRVLRTDTTCWDYFQIVLAERITAD